MGSSWGRLFRVTTFGESHGPALGCVIEGCPPRLPLEPSVLSADLDRRRPGQSPLTTPRREPDLPRLLSGVYEGKTTGAPIAVLLENQDARPADYDPLAEVYRPSHADYTHDAKYGIRDPRGGGRASARETAARVAAGAVARALLSSRVGVRVVAWVQSVGGLALPPLDDAAAAALTREQVDANPVRCPDPDLAREMAAAIAAAQEAGDSLGGTVALAALGVPPGWGDPVFDKLEADLAKAMLSLPATQGFEIGSGFAGTRLPGSQHNDPFLPGEGGEVRLASNLAGGTLGGISSGAPLRLQVAFKPTATIRQSQRTVDRRGRATTLAAAGRHDPCVLPRAVAVVEAAALLVLADHFLRHEAQCGRAVTGDPGAALAGDARLRAGLAP